MTRTRILLAAAVLVAVLAGCSGGSDDKTPSAAAGSSAAAATSSAPPVDGGTYDSPLVLLDALNKGGVACTDYKAVAQPRGAIARGNCHLAGEEFTIGIYASAEDARAQPSMEAELLKGVSDVDMVLGRNWTVGCPNERAAQQVARVLGGEVFHDPANS